MKDQAERKDSFRGYQRSEMRRGFEEEIMDGYN